MPSTFYVIGIFHGSHDCFTTTSAASAYAATCDAIEHHDAATDYTILAVIAGGTECPSDTYPNTPDIVN